ncbi:DUF2750 domain-containing protein [Motilimonas sp. KMU-193]|uniref:DUF2750 domain-containing protein n=1 Tax=Motilimonas sp. KMU-193 TaxID=3388668 RepID=UPI00396B3F41
MSKLTEDVKKNTALFVSDSHKSETVWGLCNDQGQWLSLDSSEFEDSEVMPFWSQAEDAQCHCVDEWASFVPTKLSLEEFLEDWLTTLAADEVLVGLNWNNELDGEELEPKAVLDLYL